MISIDIDEFSYSPNEKILKDIHFKLLQGTITSVLGPSGSGKSTLLRVLMGFENGAQSSSSGGIPLPECPQPVHSYSLVPQTPYLFPWKTVEQNIALGLDDNQRQLGNTEISSRIAKILSIVGLAGMENKYPYEISVGMSQRVLFARAMINPFQSLLLDEPFSSLDALTRRELQNWLLKIIKEQNSYSLFVTHDISEAIYLSKNIYILSKKPATIIAHFLKENDSFTEQKTGKIFGPKNIFELEETIFNLL